MWLVAIILDSMVHRPAASAPMIAYYKCRFSEISLGSPDLVNKNTGYPVKFEFTINNNFKYFLCNI